MRTNTIRGAIPTELTASLCCCGLWLSAVGQAEPPVPASSGPVELQNPAEPPAAKGSVEPLQLPAAKPRVQLASFWRNAAALQAAHDSAEAASGEMREPGAIIQPPGMLPDEAPFDDAQPLEPPGAAVIVGDDAEATTAEPRVVEVQEVELATARVDLHASRAGNLLLEARDAAAEATTAEELTAVIATCREARDQAPDRPTAKEIARLAAWAYNRRGELAADEGAEHAAFDDFQEAIRQVPDYWPALHNRAVTLARYGQQAEALADFDKVVDLAPDLAIARYNRAELLSQLRRWNDAVEDYTAAIEAMPDEAALLAARGYAWHQLGRTSRAASDFNAAIRIDDSLAEAYVGRGNLYADEGLYEQAAEDFEQALRLDPRSATAYRSVAWLLSTCPLPGYRSAEKGVEAAHRAAKLLGEEDPLMLETLAVAHANAGDFHRAITYQQQAIVLVEGELRDKYQQRLALYRQGRPYRTERVARH